MNEQDKVNDKDTLSLQNKEMYAFYKTHNIDFERTNLLLFSVLKQIVLNIDKSVNSNLAEQLLKNMTCMSDKIDNMDGHLQKFQQTLNDTFSVKFSDFRQEYIRDVTAILNTNTLDHVSPLIKDATAFFVDKTVHIISEMTPHHQQPLIENISSKFDIFQSFIASETNKLLNSVNEKVGVEQFLNNVNTSMSQTHNNINNIIISSEARMETKMNDTDRKLDDIKSMFNNNNQSQITLQTNVTEMLKKFEKGITKGTVSEYITINMLRKMYNQDGASIEHVGLSKGTGDIMFSRIDRPTILIEVKDHDSVSVPKTDVQKFINDCKNNKCCGIMLAQNRSITHKTNYQIDVDGGNVLLYVGNVNFDEERISTAISIVETFKIQLDNYTVGLNEYSIDQNVLTQINVEFNNYVNQKHNLTKMVKDFNSQMTESINKLQIPSLETYLSSKFATTNGSACDSKCPYCEKPINASLKMHLRFCKNYTGTTPNATNNNENAIGITTTKTKIKKEK